MIAVADLSLRYRPDGEWILHHLSHEFTDSAVTAITGVSGRGKSTLLYVLGLLLRPTEGQVQFDGIDVARQSDSARSATRATRIGFVFQDAALDPSRTILDAVLEPALYAGTPARSRVQAAGALLERLGLAHRAKHRPGQISGGQAQRVAVARALINDPALILADEPTGNLDRHAATTVLDALRDASDSRTVIIATHDPFVLDQVDHVLAL